MVGVHQYAPVSSYVCVASNVISLGAAVFDCIYIYIHLDVYIHIVGYWFIERLTVETAARGDRYRAIINNRPVCCVPLRECCVHQWAHTRTAATASQSSALRLHL